MCPGILRVVYVGGVGQHYETVSICSRIGHNKSVCAVLAAWAYSTMPCSTSSSRGQTSTALLDRKKYQPSTACTIRDAYIHARTRRPDAGAESASEGGLRGGDAGQKGGRGVDSVCAKDAACTETSDERSSSPPKARSERVLSDLNAGRDRGVTRRAAY